MQLTQIQTLMQVPTLALPRPMLFGSKVAKVVKVPKVTFFLLIGFVLGQVSLTFSPSRFNTISIFKSNSFWSHPL